MSSNSANEGLLAQSPSDGETPKTSAGNSHTGRRMSFGIGGAGNIRNITEATIHDFYVAQNSQERRRSSAAESTSGSSASRMTRVMDGMKSMFGSSPPKDAGRKT